MKKLLVLGLAVIMVLSCVTVSLAATTVGGNVRTWYKWDSNGTNTFKFDRLALDVNSTISDNNGISAQVLFRQEYETPAALELNYAYYYQKNLVGGDELDLGYVYLPFATGNSVTFDGDYANQVAEDGTAGVTYNYANDLVNITVGLGNASNGVSVNAGTEGFEYAGRVEVTPAAGLTVGAGYYYDKSATSYNQQVVGDAYYTTGPVGALVEYTYQKAENADSTGVLYAEGTYKVADNFKLLAAGTANNGDSDYYVGGFVYTFAPNTALQTEYKVNEDNSTALNLRVKTSF